MLSRQRRSLLILVCLVVSAAAWSAWPLQAQSGAKKPLTYDVFESWHSIQGTRLSEDGQWLAYAVTSQAEDGELFVRNLASGKEIKAARGTNPQFTPDAKFVIFTIVPTKADDEAERNNQTTPAAGAGAGGGEEGGGNQAQNRNSLGIMSLPGGEVTTVPQISTFRLAETSSTWLAYHKGRAGGAAGRGGRGGNAGRGGGGGRGGAGGGRAGEPPTQEPPANPPAAQNPPAGQAGGTTPAPAPPEKRKDAGTDLTIRNLTTGQETVIPEVTEFAWDKSGTWIVYAVSSTDAAKDGAFARRTSEIATPKALHTGKGHYKSFAFDENGTQLAFLSDQAEYDKPVSPYRVYYWKPTDAGAATELVAGATRGMPAGMVVADAAPRFSEDAQRLYLATAPPPPPPADPNAKKPAPLPVDLWSFRDPTIQPMQRIRATQERNRNYRAVVHLSDKRFVQLATPDLPNVNPGADPVRSIGTSDLPYRQEVSWDSSYNDVYLVDLKTGQRRKVLDHHGGAASLSPAGKYILFFDEPTGDWFSYRISDGLKVNLTERIDANFWREDHDTPDLAPPYGSAGWTTNDGSVILYDKFDMWEIKPDGSAPRMLTGGEGRRQQLVFRYRTFDPEERAIPLNKPMLLTTTNDWTKATGYYRMTVGATGAGTFEKLIMMDKAMGGVTKAKNADTVVFTESRFEEFPDLWVSDTTFKTPKKISNANPQQNEYVWGKSELVEYINADGKRLRAILTKPDPFDPNKKYPMMVYIYEGLTAGLHGYSAPNVGTSINVTRYVSNGYVVLRPDIVYDTGFPGESAEKCVIPAVNTVVAMGFIDPKRIGIQGHSWGGYQITHLITRTDIFAAVEAGASVSNMISAYGGIRWESGMVRQFQYEKTQSRIGSTPWNAPLKFIENSPIFWVEKIHTPYLTIHNDADGAVPWYQGIEFNMAMRRLGKEAYMFNYNGQGHGLSNRDYMKHWTVHMDEFFDHYLLGKPRPEWMDKGVSYLDRGTRDVSGMFKKVVVPPATNGGKGGE